MSSEKQEETAIAPLEFLPLPYFKWERLTLRLNKSGILKKRGAKGRKAWNPRFFALHFNYLVFFKPGKGKEGEPDQNAIAKDVIYLESIVDRFKIEEISDNSMPGFPFTVVTTRKTYYLSADSFESRQSWIKELQRQVEKIQIAARRVSEEETIKKLKEVQKYFPENMVIPRMVPVDQAEKWLADTRILREQYKKWEGFVHSLALFAEFQTGRLHGYVSWFTNKTKGPHQNITIAEEEVLKHWESDIQVCLDEAMLATETMFYLEDLATTIERINATVKMIDVFNQLKAEFYSEKTIRFQEEKQELINWSNKLSSYPSFKTITYDIYESGSIVSDEEQWEWNQNSLILERKKYRVIGEEVLEKIEFSAKDIQSQLVNIVYGVILWNNKSCVWTHPRCPFIIRYEWYDSKKILKQYFSIKPEKDSRKIPPALSDWQLTNGILRAVTVGKRDPEPEVPPVTEWQIHANLPPPVLMLVVNFYAIQTIMRPLLGLH